MRVRADGVGDAVGEVVVVLRSDATAKLDLLGLGRVGLALALPFGALGRDVEIALEPQDERVFLVRVLKEDVRVVAALEAEARGARRAGLP